MEGVKPSVWGISQVPAVCLDAAGIRKPMHCRHCVGRWLTAALACRMGQLFKPKAMDYIHRAIVQAIADAKAEAAPCKQPPREELPQDLVEMLTGYKQVRDSPGEMAPGYKHVCRTVHGKAAPGYKHVCRTLHGGAAAGFKQVCQTVHGVRALGYKQLC